MNCHQAEKLISRLVDGRLEAGSSDRLKEHLKVCPSCAQMLTDYQKMKDMMTGLKIKEAEPLPYFEQRLKARLKASSRASVWAMVERWYAAAVPVFLVVAVILMGVLFLVQPEEVQMSQSEMVLFQIQGPPTATKAIFEEEKPENRQLLILFAGLDSQEISGRNKQ
ncbi:MAG: zf-HC2 domain-containing protein [Acidobacteriota bacterium]|nr:zf-HC2 domain-containing protein [Acidobacteriota bacterium]MDW3228426.1 zf-HC2 domain-containing protein [Acidobacteriota bacterium]MDY0231304.1 zf-HC2 domain-containing protein [Candidatus Saccharicenans sp.]